MSTVSDLFTPLTEDEVLEAMLGTLERLDIPARSWRRGGTARTMLRVFASTCASFTQIVALAIRSGFLDTAEGDWLSVLAEQHFQVTRLPATFATGTLRFVNGGGGVYEYPPDTVYARSPATGKQYTNANALSLAANSTVDVIFRAVEQGSASSAAPDTITEIVTTMLGVEVTNPAALLGSDEETDPQLRLRARESQAALSPNGPADAYSSVAKKAPTSAPITRTKVVSNPLTGAVILFVTNAAGAVPSDDLEIVDAAIRAWAVPIGITVSIQEPVVRLVPVTLTAYVKDSTESDASIREKIGDALAAYFAGIPIGGVVLIAGNAGGVWRETLIAVATDADDKIATVQIASPAASLTLDPNEIATLGTVTTTVVRS